MSFSVVYNSAMTANLKWLAPLIHSRQLLPPFLHPHSSSSGSNNRAKWREVWAGCDTWLHNFDVCGLELFTGFINETLPKTVLQQLVLRSAEGCTQSRQKCNKSTNSDGKWGNAENSWTHGCSWGLLETHWGYLINYCIVFESFFWNFSKRRALRRANQWVILKDFKKKIQTQYPRIREKYSGHPLLTRKNQNRHDSEKIDDFRRKCLFP